MSRVSVTVLVEPDPGGHRFQAVAHVAEVAARTGGVLLLTSEAGARDEAYDVLLGGAPLRTEQPFTEIHPPTRTIARAVADACRRHDVDTVVVMDADQSLKRWWYVARSELRGLPRRPRVVFFLTRYPAKVGLTDTFGWRFRTAKAVLTLAAMATGTLHRAVGFAGRDDMSPGWLVKRARDPAVCLAHSRDRARLREELGLPRDRTIAGIFGVIEPRKNAPLVLDALDAAGLDADLLLAGGIWPEVHAWIDAQPPERRARIIVRDGFLADEEMDKLVAAVDVCPIALTNNGPSGIQGKALAAGVPVVTAGAEVRAREIRATDGGEAAELSAESIGAAVRRVLARDPDAPRRSTVPPATAEAFAETVLGPGSAGADRPRSPSLPPVDPTLRALARTTVLTVNTPFARRRALRALTDAPRPLKLEIGGLAERPGWVVTNVNALARNHLDATRRWPLEDGAVEVVYSDNVIEHLPLGAGRRMLAEAHRCLRPGGVIRTVTPDLRTHVDLYLAGASPADHPEAKVYREMGVVTEHPIDWVQIPIASFGHHEGYVYDFDTLRAELERAGFHGVRRCELGHSDHPDLAGLDQRGDEGGAQMAVEATR